MTLPEEWVERGAEALRKLQRDRIYEDVTSRQAGTYWIDKADDLARAVLETLPIEQVGWLKTHKRHRGGPFFGPGGGAPHKGDIPVYVLSGDAQ